MPALLCCKGKDVLTLPSLSQAHFPALFPGVISISLSLSLSVHELSLRCDFVVSLQT